MRVLLAYPPDFSPPAMPFGALALLNACLKAHGIESLVLDVNALAFKAMIAPEVIARYAAFLDDEIARLRSRSPRVPSDEAALESLERLCAYPRSMITHAHAAFDAMRDREQFLDPDRWIRLDRTLRATHAFLNAATPLFDPRSNKFRDGLYPYLASEPIDPYAEFYAAGLAPRIEAFRPDLIAWTCPFSPQIGTAMYASKLLRRRFPSVPFLMGGTGISDAVGPALEDPRFYDYIDYAIVGDGEEAIVDLCDAIGGEKSKDEVAGLWRREKGVIVPPRVTKMVDMNLAPVPDYTDIDFSIYAMPEPAAVYITSRGCYYGKCTFCPDSFRQGFRKRSPEKVYADVEKIVREQGISHIHFFDPLTPPVTLEYLARRAAKDALPIHWYAEVKFEPIYMNTGYVKKLAEGGCRQLQFGLESGVQRVLDAMDKGNRLDHIEIILENLRTHGITAVVTWFVGFPNETRADAEETWRYLMRHKDAIRLSLFVGKFGMGHGELVYLHPEDYGIRLTRDAHGFVAFERLNGEDWDVEPLAEAFNARSDVLTAAGGAGLYYAAHRPDGLSQIRADAVIGPPSFDDPPLAERRARIPNGNHVVVLTPKAGGPRHGVVYAAAFGECHDLDAADLDLLAAIAHRPTTLGDLISHSEDPHATEARLVRWIDRGAIAT